MWGVCFWLKACGGFPNLLVLGSSAGKFLRFPLCTVGTFSVHVKFGKEKEAY
jgi:hypothetical protein